MRHSVSISSYPLPTEEKTKLFRHPQRKPHYGPETLKQAYDLLAEPIIKPGYDLVHYNRQIGDLCDRLIAESDGAPRFIADTLKSSIEWKLQTHPINGKKENTREDGTPLIAHHIEPALRMAVFHADWDETIATIHHDDFEDGLIVPRNLREILMAGSTSDESSKLADATIWQTYSVSNFYKVNRIRKVNMESLDDWKDPKIFNFLKERMLIERLYLSHINSLEMTGPRIIKIFADRLHNLQSKLPLPQAITKDITSMLKGLLTIDWAKKYSNITTTESLRAMREKANNMIEAFGEEVARDSLKVPKGWDVPFPIDVFFHLDYHENKESFEQEEHDQRLVEITGIRRELTPDVMRSLPYVGSSVAVIFAPEKQYYHRADAHPIEIQIPRIIRKGKLFGGGISAQLMAEDVVAEIQRGLDSYGLPFEAKYIESLLPGKIGMDRIMVRLEFRNGEGSFVDYLKKSGNPLAKYEKTIGDIQALLHNFVFNHFKSTEIPAATPNKKSFKQILKEIKRRGGARLTPPP